MRAEIKGKKGVSLTFETLIVAILVLIVLGVVAYFFVVNFFHLGQPVDNPCENFYHGKCSSESTTPKGGVCNPVGCSDEKKNWCCPIDK